MIDNVLQDFLAYLLNHVHQFGFSGVLSEGTHDCSQFLCCDSAWKTRECGLVSYLGLVRYDNEREAKEATAMSMRRNYGDPLTTIVAFLNDDTVIGGI